MGKEYLTSFTRSQMTNSSQDFVCNYKKLMHTPGRDLEICRRISFALSKSSISKQCDRFGVKYDFGYILIYTQSGTQLYITIRKFSFDVKPRDRHKLWLRENITCTCIWMCLILTFMIFFLCVRDIEYFRLI